MNFRRFRTRLGRWGVLIGLSYLLAGCAAGDALRPQSMPSATPAPTAPARATFSPSPPTVPTPLPRLTSIRTATPPPTATSVPSFVFGQDPIRPIYNTVYAVATPTDLAYHWLLAKPCATPCWEGIAPGQTPVDQAIALLQKVPNISRVQKQPHNSAYPAVPEGEVTWTFPDEGTRGKAFFDPADPHRITEIDLFYNRVYRLADVIAAYDPPSDVIAFNTDTPDGGYIAYGVYFVYVKQRFMVEVYTHQAFTQPTIAPDTLVYSPIFFAPTPITNGMLLIKPHGWMSVRQGYQPYIFYCRNNNPATSGYIDSCHGNRRGTPTPGSGTP